MQNSETKKYFATNWPVFKPLSVGTRPGSNSRSSSAIDTVNDQILTIGAVIKSPVGLSTGGSATTRANAIWSNGRYTQSNSVREKNRTAGSWPVLGVEGS
jgi:hypothetical protein